MIRRFASIFVALALASPSSAALSDVSCDDRARMTDTLTQTLQAERRGTGLRDPETTLEVWVSPTNGDWIIVQHYATGTSCIVALGEYWEAPLPNPA
ncbi:MAG: hypothetical protein AAGA15_01910 [Pseudomonadota bacterium]